MTKIKQYKIVRPPLARNFELPSRDNLLMVAVGDLVKVIFQVGDETPERMWVIVTDLSNVMDEWVGTINNDAVGKETAAALPDGTVVKFHPLDVIAIDKK